MEYGTPRKASDAPPLPCDNFSLSGNRTVNDCVKHRAEHRAAHNRGSPSDVTSEIDHRENVHGDGCKTHAPVARWSTPEMKISIRTRRWGDRDSVWVMDDATSGSARNRVPTTSHGFPASSARPRFVCTRSATTRRPRGVHSAAGARWLHRRKPIGWTSKDADVRVFSRAYRFRHGRQRSALARAPRPHTHTSRRAPRSPVSAAGQVRNGRGGRGGGDTYDGGGANTNDK